MPKFLRHTSHKYSKLGVRRKKKQVWRRPTGRDNKMREQRKGKPAIVSVGYCRDKKEKGKIENKIPVTINNISQLSKVKKENIALMGKVGKKKKLEIAKKAKEMGIKIYKLNVDKFIKQNEKKSKSKDKKVDVEVKKEEKK